MKKARGRGEIFLYFSALPQYLRRKRPGYAILLRHITPSNLHALYKRKWGRFCASKKEIGTHFGATKARESSSSCKISTRDEAVVRTQRHSSLGEFPCTGRQKRKKDIQEDVRLYGNQPHLARSPQETMRLCFEPSDIRR